MQRNQNANKEPSDELEFRYVLPTFAGSIPDFDTLLSACRGAVAVAARHWPDLEAWWRQDRKDVAAS